MNATIFPEKKNHYPVLLNEIISIITPQYGGTFIDCTFGQGGYTKKILEHKMQVNTSQMDYVLPNELVDGMITAGGKKSTVSIKNLLLRGFYSGAILGLATCLAITVGIQSGMPFLGSVIFPLWILFPFPS